MKTRKSHRRFAALFTAGMLLFCACMTAFTVMRGSLDFQWEDLNRSLETSYGRERKQQAEYDQVSEELPLTRAELEETQPLADAAAARVTQLKAERKQLRAEKKALEEALKEEEEPHE